ncbi:MAG: FAD-binding oxidoreductase [Acidimicrobiia bacterium]|nr:FAD-binding oxidoreductase [Acidimicrobiia bacterium]
MDPEPRTTLPPLGPGVPTPPIAITGGADAAATAIDAQAVPVPAELVTRLGDVCSEVVTDPASTAEASRDWWPLAMIWATEGQVPARAAVVARPSSTEEVAAVAAACNEARVPLTVAAGRSGVCGASVPVHGGVVLDMCSMAGITSVDETSLVLDVAPGTFGDHLEAELRSQYGLTVGHWPQSVALSTVGGWLACRGAGQLSNRYGKIEDMVVGLDVVLANGTVVHTGGNARAATGPDLNQLFVGSEGTLGIICGARLRLHPLPPHERRAAFGFASFADGLEACRRIFRRGARPAVLRLYDAFEADRNYDTGDRHVLLVLDEGDMALTNATMEVVAEECDTAERLDDGLVAAWLSHRNDVSALEKVITRGLVVDTMEITGPWAALPAIYDAATAAISAVDGTLVASAHQSHAYSDGACLYFTFAGQVEPEARDGYYRAVWDAGTHAVLAAGGALSHHHGVGINRSRFMSQALGTGLDVVASVKAALDPHGILNPGKLGLPSPFGSHAFGGTPAT